MGLIARVKLWIRTCAAVIGRTHDVRRRRDAVRHGLSPLQIARPLRFNFFGFGEGD